MTIEWVGEVARCCRSQIRFVLLHIWISMVKSAIRTIKFINDAIAEMAQMFEIRYLQIE